MTLGNGISRAAQLEPDCMASRVRHGGRMFSNAMRSSTCTLWLPQSTPYSRECMSASMLEASISELRAKTPRAVEVGLALDPGVAHACRDGRARTTDSRIRHTNERFATDDRGFHRSVNVSSLVSGWGCMWGACFLTSSRCKHPSTLS